MAVQYMKGSEGNLDYIIVGEFDGLRIGIKPLLYLTNGDPENPYITICGCRMRVIPLEEVLNLKFKVETSLPEYKFQNVNVVRASVVFAAALPPIPPEMPFYEFKKSITEGGLLAKIAESISPLYNHLDDPKVAEKELNRLILSTYEDLYKVVTGQVSEVVKEISNIVNKDKDMSNIIPFKKPTKE